MVLKGLDVLGVGVDLMSVVINHVALFFRGEATKVVAHRVVFAFNR